MSYGAFSVTTFGNTTIEGATGQLSNNILGTGFDSGAGGTVVSITAYLTPTGTRLVKFAMYDTLDNLIAQTNEISAASGAGWYTATFSSPPTASASTTYRLLGWANGSFQCTIARASATGLGMLQALSYTTSFPNPASTTTNNFRYSIYATYAAPPTSTQGMMMMF